MDSSVHPGILAAAQITAAYSTLYSMTFVNILICKKYYAKQARARGQDFDRYTSLDMRPADRLQANFMEWTPAFLGPLWSLALTHQLDAGACIMAWTYLGLRTLYFGLVLNYGVHPTGMNRPLWAATFPGYACLTYLQIQALRLLWA
uniref:Uncharacterized protein n=1 Tax=Entomoneis paludosa TaxID=265537 RepID=A0A7S2YMZ8_9STRA